MACRFILMRIPLINSMRCVSNQGTGQARWPMPVALRTEAYSSTQGRLDWSAPCDGIAALAGDSVTHPWLCRVECARRGRQPRLERRPRTLCLATVWDCLIRPSSCPECRHVSTICVQSWTLRLGTNFPLLQLSMIMTTSSS